MAGTPQRLKGILTVTVLKAKNLKKSDLLGENDCYVVLSLEPLTKFVDDRHIRRLCRRRCVRQLYDACTTGMSFIFLISIRI